MANMSSALGEIASDASLERTSFLSQSGDQLKRFVEANRDRIKEIGGLVLIDDDPDYLSVAPDGSFRSRTRYQDDVTGEWKSETEVIESAAELAELYNPAEVFAAFAEAAPDAAAVAPSATFPAPSARLVAPPDAWAAPLAACTAPSARVELLVLSWSSLPRTACAPAWPACSAEPTGASVARAAWIWASSRPSVASRVRRSPVALSRAAVVAAAEFVAPVEAAAESWALPAASVAAPFETRWVPSATRLVRP